MIIPSFISRSGTIASGNVGWPHLASGSVNSGKVGDSSVLSGSVGSGQIASGHLASGFIFNITPTINSGNVQSGHIASGTVQGFFGTTRHIASGTVGVWDLGSGAVVVGTVASGAVVSGNIGSGQVGSSHIADEAVASGDIASGSISRFKIASGSLAGFELGSGAIVSGRIASGQVGFGHLQNESVQSGTIASGTIFRFHIASGSLAGFELGSGAIISGRIASGQIGSFHLADGAVTSGDIASGQVFQFHLASGAINSGHINAGGSPDATKFLDGSFNWSTPGAASVASGDIGSGKIASGAVQGFFGTTRQIASGTIGLFDFGSGAIQSGHIASGQIGTGHLANGAVTSGDIASGIIFQMHIADQGVTSGNYASGSIGRFHIASGQLAGFELGSGAIVSGRIASGQIGSFHLADGAVTSGDVASGAVTTYHLASGATATRARFTGTLFSGTFTTIVTEERISGVRAVQLSQSGTLRIAMASVSGRMPAVGVVVDNTESGVQTNVYTAGIFQIIDGLADYSGYLGQQLFVGRSGQVVSASGSFNSGGLLSGDVTQPVGVPFNSGGLLLELAVPIASVVGLITSGDIASGQIGQMHMAAGAINSGHLAANSVLSGNIASGQISTFHLASPAVLSGNIGSGQVGTFHIASGAVTSGRLGVTGTPDGTKVLRDDFTWAAVAGLVSGAVQSGHVASGAVQGFFGSTRHVASGTIGSFDFGSGAVTAGAVGSGAVVSGNIGSGQIGTNHHASGSIVPMARYVTPSNSGTPINFLTEEPISGVRAVRITASGTIQIAMASVAGRMPAHAVVVDNVTSGFKANIYTVGVFQFTSGMSDYSGYVGTPLLVGRSGEVVQNSGSWNSGGLVSGDTYQVIGTPVSSGAVLLTVETPSISGFILGSGIVRSGNIASGQVGTNHLAQSSVKQGHLDTFSNWSLTTELPANTDVMPIYIGAEGLNKTIGPSGLAECLATYFPTGFITAAESYIGSGAVVSGTIASGQIGRFHIASGQLAGFELGSGAIVSGRIASGQVGTGHLADGAVTSGDIAAGAVTTEHLFDGAILSGKIGSGQIGRFHVASGQLAGFELGSGAIVSGRIASGQLGTFHGSSGMAIDRSQYSVILASGVSRFPVITEERISGVRAVAISPSGALRIAMAGVSGRMPAVGVVFENVESGIETHVVTAGAVRATSGLLIASGQIGQNLYVGRSGDVSVASGWFNSGGLLSGDIHQPIGVMLGSGAALVEIAAQMPFVPTTNNNITISVPTGELISGIKAVAWNNSGGFSVVRAERASGLRLPAIGVTVSGALSGIACDIVCFGAVYGNVSGQVASGFLSKHLYVGSGGHIVNLSGFHAGASSGAPFLSGDGQQAIGFSISGGVFVHNTLMPVISGFYNTLPWLV